MIFAPAHRRIAVYGVNPAKQTWLPVGEVAHTLGLDGPQQVQELAEAYGMTVGMMPDGGVTGLLIPPKVRLYMVPRCQASVLKLALKRGQGAHPNVPRSSVLRIFCWQL